MSACFNCGDSVGLSAVHLLSYKINCLMHLNSHCASPGEQTYKYNVNKLNAGQLYSQHLAYQSIEELSSHFISSVFFGKFVYCCVVTLEVRRSLIMDISLSLNCVLLVMYCYPFCVNCAKSALA